MHCTPDISSSVSHFTHKSLWVANAELFSLLQHHKKQWTQRQDAQAFHTQKRLTFHNSSQQF